MSKMENNEPFAGSHSDAFKSFNKKMIPLSLRSSSGLIIILLVYVQLAMIVVITRRDHFGGINYNVATIIASSITLMVGAYALLRESRRRRLSEELLEDTKLLAEYLALTNRKSSMELRLYQHENQNLVRKIDDALARDKNIGQDSRESYRVVQMAQFANEQVTLDGTMFIRSTFENSVLVFNGLSSARFVDCDFINCEWRLERQAKETLEFLAHLYLGLGTEGSSLVEGVFDSIRSGHLISQSSGKMTDVQSSAGGTL